MVDRLQGREVGRRGGFELKRISVAIDGPSGAGKSTLARMAAKELGYIYVDTGAIYRAVALYTIRCGVSADNPADIVGLLEDISIKLGYKDGVQRIMLNGEDVSEEIRSSDVTVRASVVSAIPKVREFLLGMQRSMAEKGGVIMDGSVRFPCCFTCSARPSMCFTKSLVVQSFAKVVPSLSQKRYVPVPLQFSGWLRQSPHFPGMPSKCGWSFRTYAPCLH